VKPATLGERAEYLLYNPYHDERGRFASKSRAVSVVGGAQTPGDKLKSPGQVERESIAKRIFGPMARDLSRSEFRYRALRFGIDVTMDRVLYTLAGVHVTKYAALLGATAGATLIGGSLAPVLFGLGAATAATLIWFALSEQLTDRAFYGFLNRYNDSSKTGKTVGISTVSKYGRRAAWLDRLAITPMEIPEAIGNLATRFILNKGQAGSMMESVTGQAGGSIGTMTGSDVITHGANTADILEGIQSSVEAVGNLPVIPFVPFADPYESLKPVDVRTGEEIHDREKAMIMLPHILNVIKGYTTLFMVPALPETSGLEELGFAFAEATEPGRRKGIYVIDKLGAKQFMRDFENDTIPRLGTFDFDDEELEEILSEHAV
jgi:hypothetical protein